MDVDAISNMTGKRREVIEKLAQIEAEKTDSINVEGLQYAGDY